MTFIVVSPSGDTTAVDEGSPAAQQVIQMSYLVTLTGADGTVWDLNSGPVQLNAGARLFNMGAVTHWSRRSPAIDGARRTGMRTDEKELLLPISTTGTDWNDWRATDTAFFRSIAPENEALLTVIAPDAVTKSMRVRLSTDGDDPDDFDPLLLSRKSYPNLEMTAFNPFWEGDPVEVSFQVNDPVPWLEPPGPPIYLNPPGLNDNATISNPGDVIAWPDFIIAGQNTGFTVGVGDGVVSSSAVFGTGSVITVMSHPTKRMVVDEDGNRINALMDKRSFAAIPPGAEVPMRLAVTGYGPDTEVTVRLVPLYRRPL
jgi:hypothetical protein